MKISTDIEFKDILSKIEEAKSVLANLQNTLSNLFDGYFYIIKLRSYGSITFYKFNNIYEVTDFCEPFISGDDGLCDLYTDNKELDANTLLGIDNILIKNTSRMEELWTSKFLRYIIDEE